MQQSIFAVLALGLVLLLSLNSNQARADRITRTVSGTLEVEARGIASEVLDHIDGFAFDGNAAATSPLDFTLATDFGPAGRAFDDPTIGDIDDFDGIVAHTVVRNVSNPDTGAQESLQFSVAVSVQYVNATPTAVVPTSGVPTFEKQVSVQVSHDHLTSPITLSRVISFGT